MPSTPPDTPIHVRVLANRQGRPGALLWRVAPEGVGGLLPWLAQEGTQALAGRTPCLWVANDVAEWPEAVQKGLSAAGMQTMPAEHLAECGTAFEASDPVRWIVGEWYLQPPFHPTSAQAASRANALRLIQLISTDAETHELEEVFRHDAHLSYQLLRLVNSAGVSNGRTISSFAQAILMLGRQALRRWVNLLLFSARDDDPRSAMLMAHVVLRARGLELLAHDAGLDRAGQDQAFMAGMFSMLGVLFGQPLEQALRPLNLALPLQQALLEQTGDLGLLLQAWQASECGDDERLQLALSPLGLSHQDHNRALPLACDWMLNMTAGASPP